MTNIGSTPSFSEVVSSHSEETSNSPATSGGGSVDHLSSGFALQITIHKLNGKNYLEWFLSVKLAIDSYGKEDI